MAKYNSAVEVTFNDNDGAIGWRVNPESAQDVARHWRIFGYWRTRWMFFKKFWRALMIIEGYAEKETDIHKIKPWIFKAEIPE